MSVILAIDYGTKRIGLAISHVGFAEPLLILENNNIAISEIKKIIEEEEVEKVVVGLSENVMAEKTKEFADKLSEHISVPIVFTDETLSSKTVHEKLRTSKKKIRSGHIDHFAAALFLQEWLDIQ